MNRGWKSSLSRQFIWFMSGFLFLILVAAAGLGLYSQSIEAEYEKKVIDLRQKQQYAVALEDSLNDMFFEARGYLGFRIDEPFLTNYEDQKNSIVDEINQLEPELETKEERAYITNLKNELINYYKLFEKAKVNVASDNTEGLRGLSKDEGGSDLVYDLRDQTRELVSNIENEIYTTEQNLINRLSNLQVVFVSFVIFLLLIATILAGIMARRIGKPLQELALASSQVASGESEGNLEVPHLRRSDELGELARSFHLMVKNIKQNEKALISSNEALIEQSEELKGSKFTLEQNVKAMNVQKKVLEHRNELNRSLASTLTKNELLQSIITNMIHILNSDKGIIVMLNQGKDYASLGVSQEKVHEWIDHLVDGPGVKAIEQKKFHIVQRAASIGEAGYHDGKSASYDLYIPILSDNEAVALLCITRIGEEFTTEEVTELSDLSRQISLALDKLRLYETTENERQVNREILNTIREGIQLVDREGTTRAVNDQMCSMLDACFPDGANEKPFVEWSSKFLLQVDVEDRLNVNAYIHDVITGVKPKQSELIYQTNTEPSLYIQMYYEHLYNGEKFIGSIFVHRDITREHEVDEMKNEFVSTVSHELRTPLSSVLGFTELMLSKELKPEKQKKYLNTIYKEAKRLTSLINDFLDIQRMEAGKQNYDKTRINVKVLVEEVLDSYRDHSRLHSFVVEDLAVHHEIIGDADKIKQVFNNFVSNAVKYSPEGGTVLTRFRVEKSHLYVDIKDEGLGIPQDALSKLFTKFYRVDNSDRRQIGGTGLGLAISKEIMTAHNGDVLVTSELGEGSTFTLVFPLEIEEQPLKSGELVDGGVLIVEDDDSLALLLMEEITESGFTAHHCRSGESAIELLEQTTPKGIVLDIMLDGRMSGWDVLKAVKETERTKNIPIFVSTVSEEKQRGFDLGAKDYLIKPYPPQNLTKSLIKSLKNENNNGKILIPDYSIEENEKGLSD
ncbi:ATP-binding protein [Bacillus sp. RAR_GA_16]|uniref:ATP-binding protein n=1 Tax=Bacillus sp. RAR_GA_16 TaxID=2876774 RepID=UPI001CCC4FEC|nr:ATP-binding protein [Bacillus sp. RAR_GA_16]MCA0173614.1 response regulator [Bacillus sp. RAR_GA_16]